MIVLPDANAFSAYFRGHSPALAEAMEAAFETGQLHLSVIVLAELRFGAWKAEKVLGTTRFSRRVRDLATLVPVEPFTETMTSLYARVRFELERRGEKIGDRDTLIAAQALQLKATLVTRNVREFERVPGLKVINWETD